MIKNSIKHLSIGLLVLFASIAIAQQDDVVMTIAGEDISLKEFEAIFKKNNNNQVIDKKSVDEYVQLFVNFKLKVKEAKALGLDTAQSFIRELAGYRKQLAQPYLTDKEATDGLVKEAYDRLKYDIKASHIMVKIGPDALPKDTALAYQKALDIKKRLEKGEDFEKLAKELSEDPSAATNGGDLGYFTSMYMVYPFETAAYTTEIGKISNPVRTRYGYHILKVTDKREARGEIKVAHIMIRLANDAAEGEQLQAKKKIDELYEQVISGEGNFSDLAAEYSDDKGSSKKGGELPMFGTGKMVRPFEDAAFSLKEEGEISKPVQTKYGWHIIKLLEKKDLPPYEEMEAELRNKVAKDSRSDKSKDVFVAKLKKEYNFQENLKERDDFYKVVTEDYFEGKWDVATAAKLNKTIFTIGAREYTQTDFANYLYQHQLRTGKMPILSIVNAKYKDFVESSIIAYEESRLEEKYMDFRLLMNEYRDGILLFELTDQKVWSKAVKDTVGLMAFYEKNKDQFMWQERVDALVVIGKDKGIVTSAQKLLKSGKSKEEILADINKDSQLNIRIEEGKFQKNENDYVDQVFWKKGTTSVQQKDKNYFSVRINELIASAPKTLKEARGLVTSEYQNYLEKEWIEELKGRYDVMVQQDVLMKLK